jgi:predicted lipoprotein with Yx(FWY)xxD motif
VTKYLAIVGLVVAGLAIAAFGGMVMAADDSARSAPDRAGKKPTVVQVQSSQYGNVLFDGKGFVLYLFTKDKPNKSRCKGDCAEAWPPYIKKGKLKAGDGVDQSALGTTERKDGSKQVTYHGRPLYYYEHDDKPGQILCHDVTEFGGDWLVVQPDGQPAP